MLGEVAAPTLIVHGTKDTFVSIESSRRAASQLTAEYKLVEICVLPECNARPDNWCYHPVQGHHLERYYLARERGLITDAEFDAVKELSRPRANSYALIRVASLEPER